MPDSPPEPHRPHGPHHPRGSPPARLPLPVRCHRRERPNFRRPPAATPSTGGPAPSSRWSSRRRRARPSCASTAAPTNSSRCTGIPPPSTPSTAGARRWSCTSSTPAPTAASSSSACSTATAPAEPRPRPRLRPPSPPSATPPPSPCPPSTSPACCRRPGRRASYRYQGSLTTADDQGVFRGGVQWVVLREPVAAAPAQIDAHRALVDAPGNARDLQPRGGREILTDG